MEIVPPSFLLDSCSDVYVQQPQQQQHQQQIHNQDHEQDQQHSFSYDQMKYNCSGSSGGGDDDVSIGEKTLKNQEFNNEQAQHKTQLQHKHERYHKSHKKHPKQAYNHFSTNLISKSHFCGVKDHSPTILPSQHQLSSTSSSMPSSISLDTITSQNHQKLSNHSNVERNFQQRQHQQQLQQQDHVQQHQENVMQSQMQQLHQNVEQKSLKFHDLQDQKQQQEQFQQQKQQQQQHQQQSLNNNTSIRKCNANNSNGDNLNEFSRNHQQRLQVLQQQPRVHQSNQHHDNKSPQHSDIGSIVVESEPPAVSTIFPKVTAIVCQSSGRTPPVSASSQSLISTISTTITITTGTTTLSTSSISKSTTLDGIYLSPNDGDASMPFRLNPDKITSQTPITNIRSTKGTDEIVDEVTASHDGIAQVQTIIEVMGSGSTPMSDEKPIHNRQFRRKFGTTGFSSMGGSYINRGKSDSSATNSPSSTITSRSGGLHLRNFITPTGRRPHLVSRCTEFLAANTPSISQQYASSIHHQRHASSTTTASTFLAGRNMSNTIGSFFSITNTTTGTSAAIVTTTTFASTTPATSVATSSTTIMSNKRQIIHHQSHQQCNRCENCVMN